MPLNLPGSTTAQLVASATPTAATNGLEKLDPRFLALLQQNEVSTENMAKLGNAGCKSMALFGHVGRDEARLEAYLKSVLNLDAQARAEDIIPVAQLVIVWTACRKRAEVETEAQAQRVVNHLPPVLTAEDHSAAREALEKKLKRPVPDHRVPSENYFQRKVGEAEGKYTAEKLTEVTNLVQEEAQKKPKGQSAASSNYLDFDDAGRPTGLKSKTTDFTVPMPTNEASFKNRFEVMDHVHLMLQMRFLSNPVLATYEPGMFKDYCNDFLCGERVWAFVLRGDNDEPTASPSLRQVCNYDWNIRKLMVRLMKRNVDIKSALEQAMGDQDLRTLYFTTGFSMEANTAECKALSAPCLEEMHHNLSRGSKRQLGSDGPASHAPGPAAGRTAKQLKRAENNKKKRANDKAALKAIKDQRAAGGGAAGGGAAPLLAIKDQRGGKTGKGKGDKGAKGGGKGAKNGKTGTPAGVVPAGVYRKDPSDGKMLCYAFSRKEKCVQDPCTFKHVCWWCVDPSHAGNDCPN